MRTDLADAVVLADCFDQRLSFGDGQRQRLFGKHVQSGLTGEHAGQHAILIGRRDDDRIQFLLVEHLAVVLVLRPNFAGFPGLCLLHVFKHTVTDGDHASGLRHVIRQMRTTTSCADDADVDSLVGRHATVTPQHRSRDDGGKGGDGRGSCELSEKVAAGNRLRCVILLVSWVLQNGCQR